MKTHIGIDPGQTGDIIPPCIHFVVYGRPQQRGSKKPFIIRGGPRKGQASMSDDNKRSKPWMAAVTAAAAERCKGLNLFANPIRLSAEFYFARPKGHFGTGRNAGKLKPSAPVFYAQQPDLSKLVRGIEDAMTGVVYRDDRQICQYGTLSKHWTESQERVEIAVELLAFVEETA